MQTYGNYKNVSSSASEAVSIAADSNRMSSNFQALVRRDQTSVQGIEPSQSYNPLSLPYDQLSIFTFSYESSAPLVGMPIYAIAQIGILPPPTPNDPADRNRGQPAQPEAFVYYPLGLLGTNHAGYASFDLTVLRRNEILDTFRQKQIEVGSDTIYTQIGLRKLWVFPFADPLLVIDALQDGDIGPQFIALRMELDENQLAGRELGRPMVAMQNPNILDWRLSPGSFTLSGSVLVGEDGCETLFPSNLSTQQFRFRQVVRRSEITYRTGSTDRTESIELRAGYVFDYTTEWFSIGHSLGQLIYSLPLAPGEVVKLAFVDWSRSDSASRTEDTGFSESLTHDQLRDRLLTETVQATLTEMQHGHSFMAGAALSVGGAYGGVAAGLTGAIGGSTSTNEDTREVTGKTMQHISDAFHQASTAMRELRSTVIVQSTQSEKANLQTRVVANYNHSHSLTMLYYEVLRHYRVVTRLLPLRHALLVDYSSMVNALDSIDNILLNRKLLESAILDDRILDCFDAAIRARCAQAKLDKAIQQSPQQPPGNPDANLFFTKFFLNFQTGSPERESAPMHVNLLRNDGAEVRLIMSTPGFSSDRSYLHNPGDRNFTQSKKDVFEVTPEIPTAARWGDIFGFRVFLVGGSGALAIDHFFVDGLASDGEFKHLCDVGLFEIGTDNEALNADVVFPVQQPPPPPPPPPSLPPGPTDEDLCCVDILSRHFSGNKAYYNRVLWLNEDPNARANRFDGISVNGAPLLNIIENRALEVSGNFVAFPVNPSVELSNSRFNRMFNPDNLPQPQPDDTFIEQLLTLPTRGIFGEAKLGHCNASEIIDKINERFWDWQKSPIQFTPPDITGVDASSRAKSPEGLTPTPFPQSLVNIVNPGSLPDPTELSGALKVLGTPGIFRDQSGLQETGTMLGKLSDNATTLASQALQGQNRKSLMDDIKASNLSDAQKTDLIGKLLTGQVDQQTKSTTPPSSGVGGTPSGTPSGTPVGSTTTGVDLGGGSTPAPSPIPTPLPTNNTNPLQPPSKPTSNKPLRANPTPKPPGLGFLISFQNPGVATTAEGIANQIKISSAGGNQPITAEGIYDPNTYVPGVSFGPPKAGVIVPKIYLNVPFKGGDPIILQTADIIAPGQIYINVSYNFLYFKQSDILAVLSTETAGSRIDPINGTFNYDNAVPFHAPPQGNIVTLSVVPHTLPPVIISGENGEARAKDFGNKVTSDMKIISIDGHYTTTNSSTNKQTLTYSLLYVTGGLDIIQT